MSKKFLFLAISYLLVTTSAFSQESKTISCSNGKDSFYVHVKYRSPAIYVQYDKIYKVSDTLLISYTGYPQSCICNDSVATFLIDEAEHFSLTLLMKKSGKWGVVNQSPLLPPHFPLVGYLIDGKLYERYKHKLVAPDKVVSDLTVLSANDQRLTAIEKYEVEYKLVPLETVEKQPVDQKQGFIIFQESPYKLIVAKKTLKNE